MATFNDSGVLSEVQAAMSAQADRLTSRITESLERTSVRLYNAWDGTSRDERGGIGAIFDLGPTTLGRVVVDETAPQIAKVDFEVMADVELQVEGTLEEGETYPCRRSEHVRVTATYDRNAHVFNDIFCDLIEIDFAKLGPWRAD